MITIKYLDLSGISGRLPLVLTKMLQGVGMSTEQVTWINGVGEDTQGTNSSCRRAGNHWESLKLQDWSPWDWHLTVLPWGPAERVTELYCAPFSTFLSLCPPCPECVCVCVCVHVHVHNCVRTCTSVYTRLGLNFLEF